MTLSSTIDCKIRVTAKFKEETVRHSKNDKQGQGAADAAGGDGAAEAEGAKRPAVVKDENEGEIDADHFSLGLGPMKLKKDRLDRFIARLMDDDLLWKKFKGKKSVVKDNANLKASMMIEGIPPELQAIEKIFTPT